MVKEFCANVFFFFLQLRLGIFQLIHSFVGLCAQKNKLIPSFKPDETFINGMAYKQNAFID